MQQAIEIYFIIINNMSDISSIIVGVVGDIMGIIFFLMPMQQIIQLWKKSIKAEDVSYLVFVVNGTMAIFFFCDFLRICNIPAFIPQVVGNFENRS